MIPKIIHYCWLSGDKIPKEYAKCMRSWKKYISDYEYVLWDTERFDINSSPWTKEAFAAKHYASAADYIRLYAVYHYGGIYLDMDMQVVKPFDDLLNVGLLLARENHFTENIEAGCFGAEKGHPYIKKCIDWLDTHTFSRKQPLMPEIMINVLNDNFKDSNYKVYPNDYFTAKNVSTGRIEKTNNTYTVHHFATKWITKGDKLERAISRKIRTILGETKFSDLLIEGVKKIRTVLRRVRGCGIFNTFKYYFKKYFFKRFRKQDS